ncbi:MAG TPA: hypothetical protein VLC48_07450 [Gemmatimonadota bacterium]|nr:hypothetical protein [Gemmatimonadota bacterium]
MNKTHRPHALIVLALAMAPSLALAQGSQRLSYVIDAAIDTESEEIRGVARLVIPFELFWSPTEIRLDLHSAGEDSLGQRRLVIESVSSQARIETVEDPAGYLQVLLPAAADPGDVIELDVRYTSRFNDSYELLGYYSYWAHEPGEYWYPDVIAAGNRRAHFRDYEVTLTYPDSFTMITTGSQAGPATRRDGTLRATYRAEHVEGFAVSLGAGFELLEFEGDGYKVVGLLPPDDPDPFRQAVRLAAEAVEWYRDAYGFFPVRQIGIIPGPRRWGGGFPLANVFMIHRANLQEDFLRWITAHELGHYYWGLYVLSATEDRLDWLNLANGIWADHLYLARTSGRTVAEVLRGGDAGNMLVDYLAAMLENREQRLGIGWAEEDSLDLGFDYNSFIRHGKATVGVYLQARRIGDDRFLALQRELLEEFRYQPLSVEAFVERLEAAGATGAGEFFEAWSRGDARIEFYVSQVESGATADGWLHRVHVRQSGTIPYDLDVEVLGAEGSRVLRTIPTDSFAENYRQVVEVTLAERSIDVRLDPDGVLPMWNSDNPGMRRAFLNAMYGAEMTPAFLALAPDYLKDQPEDDHMRLAYVERLLQLGRHAEVVATQEPLVRELPGGLADACPTRYTCWSTILLARSLNALGRSEEARGLLTAIEERVRDLRLARQWEEAAGELN